MLPQKVELYIEQHHLLEKSSRKIIVGVSGGADSVALLHILLNNGYECICAHCNFKLRGKESERDQKFVHQLSKKLNIPFYTKNFDTIDYAAKNKISVEMAARELRYRWFYELLQQLNAQAIAVAHHADDNIETLLMNLIRGTGLKGLTGIPCKNNSIVRPLLSVTRTEIENYLIEKKLKYITDSTNLSIDYQRNKIRHKVIPILEELNPSIKQTLYKNLEHFKGAYDIYQKAIEKIKQKILTQEDDIYKININALNEQVSVLNVLYEVLSLYGFSPDTILQIKENINKSVSGKVFYSDKFRLLIDRKEIIISTFKEEKNQSFLLPEENYEINFPIHLQFKKIIRNANFEVSKEKNLIHVDASLLKFPLVLRHWQEGDSFYPFGMDHSKKLSDFFIDQKLSRLEKEKIWLLLSENKIVWIVGMRLDNRFRITEKTTEILQITLFQ
ncbi:MAG TPA: tRNA lysidine(34) synthetase TilS [Paludibacteraceae bacterium]|nr:tRNA lysidine(34) synthetase TilS [Paludibacteraceae bacterium]